MTIERIQLRRGTAQQWTDTNPILGAAEIGVELGTPNKFKIGDGSSTWTELSYFVDKDSIPTLEGYVQSSEKGEALGVATLDATGNVPATQLANADLTGYATETFVTTAINNLVDSAPTALDTLNELATALGDDPDFAGTIVAALGDKSDVGHTHAISDVTGLSAALGDLETTDFNYGNRLDNIEFELSEIPTVVSATPTQEGLLIGQSSATNAETAPLSLGLRALLADQNTGGITIGNIAIGDDAGLSTTTGGSNIFVGVNAGASNTTGGNNTVVGMQTWSRATTGSHNTIVGQANQYIAFGTPGDDSENVMIGSEINLLTNNSYSNNCIIIGHAANQSTASVSNQITLGNSAITSLRCNVTSISSLSDLRDKTNIQPLPYGIDFVNRLNPVNFEWNQRDGGRVGIKSSGFIAQELMSVEDEFDAAENLNLTLRDNEEKYEAAPGNLIPVLVKAVQELSDQVRSLSLRIEELEK